ncbi:type VII secretion protein EccB [Corynebacterium pacaense]|uniref:type VII secretion protein EccB n=1 Tax=Corynebacterium pacaense TaxID=1816684 RepID=UPI0009BC0FEA|nr:type VII secretion protein EccB [Corynebacterium pacaense]
MSKGILMPTTAPQVSGHRFLLRRIEHGLVMGDVRMIHDPLGRRRRALVFGAVACSLVAVGALALALFRPAVDPGEAALIRADSGALFVRLDSGVHPVSNLASARLALGEALEPVAASDSVIAGMERGVPVGLADAPAIIDPAPRPAAPWRACQDVDSGELHVVAGGAQAPRLGEGEALLGASRSGDGGIDEHLITATGRTALPAADSEQGRIIRRNLEITPATPRLHIQPDMLNTVPELPAFSLPDPLPEVIGADSRAWIGADGAIAPITAVQHGILLDAGAPWREEPRRALGGYPEADGSWLRLPSAVPRWMPVAGTTVCSDGEGISLGGALPAGVELSGRSAARSFHTDAAGAVGVDSGHGYHVVADTGLIHPVPDTGSLSALGIEVLQQAPWSILRLLPVGSPLSAETARTPMY